MELPRLVTGRSAIRLAELSDLDAVVDYWRSSGGRYAIPLPLELATHAFWKERTLEALRELREDRAVKFYLFEPEDARIIGTLAFTEITRGFLQRCTLAYAICEEHEGRGLMSEAVERGIGFVFDELNVHRIEAFYRPTNTRSERLLQRLGFEREGVLRDLCRTADGGWEDQVLTARLNPRWRHVQGRPT